MGAKEEIEECLKIAKMQLNDLKKIEMMFKELYSNLVEEKENVKTEVAKEYLEGEIKNSYKTLIEQGIGLGKMESLINFYESMLRNGIF